MLWRNFAKLQNVIECEVAISMIVIVLRDLLELNSKVFKYRIKLLFLSENSIQLSLSSNDVFLSGFHDFLVFIEEV